MHQLDRTIRFWSLEQSNSTAFTFSKILLGHTSFVGPLAWVSPNEQFPEGGLISGVTLDGSDVVSASVDWNDGSSTDGVEY
ncbi:phospholipase A2-activating protein [Tanacetum coccineum]